MTAIQKLPAAYLGSHSGFPDQTVIRICARCPDRSAAEALAQANGHECTHGYCQPCFDAVMAEISAYQNS